MTVTRLLCDEIGASAGLRPPAVNRSAMAAMRARSIRCTDAEWDLIREAALAGGVSPSRFIREAACARAIYEQGMRRAQPGRAILQIIDELRKLPPEFKPKRPEP